MKLAKGLVMSSGAAFGLLAFIVGAANATPPVLDKVPKNALAVVGIPSPDKLQKNISALTEAIDIPFPIPAVDDLLAQMGAEKGVDKSKGVAVVFMPPPNGGKNEKGEPLTEDELGMAMQDSLFVLMPTTNYKDFIGNFATTSEGGIETGSLNGDDAFFKDLGNGYAAMSPKKSAIASLDGKAANKAAIDASLGTTGATVVDSSDVFFMINLQEAKVFMPMIMEQVKEGMAGNPAGLALEGMNEGGMGDLIKQMSDQAQTMVIGLRPDAMGVTLDMAWAFKPGSDLAKSFQGKGSTSSLITKLPNQPYFFAIAMDMSTPGMRSIVDRFAAAVNKDGNGGLPAMLTDQLKASDGAAISVGSPQGGLMGGLFTSTVSYLRTSKPDGYLAALQKGLTDLNGQNMGPMGMTSSYSPQGGEVDGQKVDTYSVKFKPTDEDDADPQMGMAMQIIFGAAGGPGGYVAKVDGGVLQTFSKNSLLLGAAMKSAGGGENITADKAIAQVGEHLPKDRMMEMYVGIKSILDAVIPLAAMGGVNLDIELPPTMPPIGFGLAGADSGAHLGIYIPTPVIKTMMAIGQQAGGMMGAEEDEAPAGNKAKGGGNQPRF